MEKCPSICGNGKCYFKDEQTKLSIAQTLLDHGFEEESILLQNGGCKHIARLDLVEQGCCFGEKYSKNRIKSIFECKEKIDKLKKEGKTVVIVNATFDLLHPAHISYLNIIIKKVCEFKNINENEVSLIVGLEHDIRTKKRKGEDRPILPLEYRKLMIENQKQVEGTWVYHDIENGNHPSDICMILLPDILIIHEEHVNNDEFNRLSKKMKSVGTQLLLIEHDDDLKYLGYSCRKSGISTSNIIRKIKGEEISFSV